MTDVLLALAGAAIGYVIGSVPTGLLVGRLAGVGDIREFGSGKTGFTNALRTYGLRWAWLVVAGDVLKGLVPVIIGGTLLDSHWAGALAGFTAVVGHTFPLFANFRGGRGVSTAFGAFLGVSPIAAFAVLVFALIVLALWRYASLMSVTGVFAGFVVLVALIVADRTAAEYLVFGIGVMLAIEINHIGNIRRLLAGTEPKLGQGGSRRAEPSS